MCLVFLGAALIALQIISEEMYSRILKTRSFTLGQSWQMLRHPELRGIVFFARTVSVIMYLSSGGILLTIIYYSNVNTLTSCFRFFAWSSN
eukprot:gene23568-25056_t